MMSFILATALTFSVPSFGIAVMSQKDSTKVKGSGVAIFPGGVLTAAHVAGPVGTKQLIRCAGKTVETTVFASIEALDLALLDFKEGTECDSMYSPVLALADPELGAVVVIDGFPGGAGMVTVGNVSAYQGVMVSKTHARYSLLVDAKVYPGSSGSGIIDSKGRLVGILTGRLCMNDHEQPPECWASAVPVSLIKRALEGP